MPITNFDYYQTKIQIVQSALEIVGARALGQPATNEETDQAGRFLNDIIKSWQVDGNTLWNIHDLQINISLNDLSFNLQDNVDLACVDIDSARVIDNSRDYPLIRISYQKYLDIFEKTQTGRPTHYAVSTYSDYDLTTEGVSKPTAFFWPAADKAYVLKYRGISLLRDSDDNSSNPDIRRRFINALKYALAADLADVYKCSISEREFIAKKAAYLLDRAKASDRDMDETEGVQGIYDYRRD